MLGLLTASLAGCSAGTGSPHGAAVAKGTVTCAQVTGTVSFAPPLTPSGRSAETTTFDLHPAKCSTSGSKVKVVTGATASAVMHGTSSCSSGLSSKPSVVDVRWSPASVGRSVATFPGFSVTANNVGDAGFVFPRVGRSSAVTGSFPGTDHGADSTMSVYSLQSIATMLGSCEQGAGLSSIPLVVGALTLG